MCSGRSRIFSGNTGEGRTAPGDTLQGATPDYTNYFFVAEFRKNTGKTTWEDGSGEEPTAKKRSSLSIEAMTKKKDRQFFFQEEIG